MFTVRTPQTNATATVTDPGTTLPAAPAAPIHRHYVHKAAQSEVLLTEWEELAEDTYLVRAQWPRAHSFYNSENGLHDPLLITETVRQAIPLLSHLAYGATSDSRQIWDHLTWTVDPAALLCASRPAEIEMRLACSDITRRAGRLAALSMAIDITREGKPLGTATTRYANQRPTVYERLRGRYADLPQAVANAIPLAPPTSPQRVGRHLFHDVVLSPSDTSRRFQLRVDLNHPVLFDHAVDHAPGMLMLEAARQAAHAVAHPHFTVVTGMHSEFHRYVELDAPCWIEAEAETTVTGCTTQVSAQQNGVTVFTATVCTVPAHSVEPVL